MAKQGFFTGLFVLLIGAIVGAAEQGKKVASAKEHYMRVYRAESEKLAEEQAEYEALVRSLPFLQGDGKFRVPVNLDDADVFALDAFTFHLGQTKQKNAAVSVVLDYLGVDAPKGKKVGVEISQADMGYLLSTYEDEIALFLSELDGSASCSGRLREHRGDFDLWLDIAFPLKHAPAGAIPLRSE